MGGVRCPESLNSVRVRAHARFNCARAPPLTPNPRATSIAISGGAREFGLLCDIALRLLPCRHAREGAFTWQEEARH